MGSHTLRPSRLARPQSMGTHTLSPSRLVRGPRVWGYRRWTLRERFRLKRSFGDGTGGLRLGNEGGVGLDPGSPGTLRRQTSRQPSTRHSSPTGHPPHSVSASRSPGRDPVYSRGDPRRWSSQQPLDPSGSPDPNKGVPEGFPPSLLDPRCRPHPVDHVCGRTSHPTRHGGPRCLFGPHPPPGRGESFPPPPKVSDRIPLDTTPKSVHSHQVLVGVGVTSPDRSPEDVRNPEYGKIRGGSDPQISSTPVVTS